MNELVTAAGVELDQMKDVPQEIIKSFFDSKTLKNNVKDLSTLLVRCKCTAEAVVLVNSELLMRKFLVFRDSIDEDELEADLKYAMDARDIENLRILLSNESGDSRVEIRRRFFVKEVLERMKYLYPSLYFPPLFNNGFDSFFFNDEFPLEILEKSYMVVLFQYGTCEATRFENNLLRKLLREQHREVIKQLHMRKGILCNSLGTYLIRRAVITNLESSVRFLIDIDENFDCFQTVAALMYTNNDKIFEMVLRTVRFNVHKYESFYSFGENFSDSRFKSVLAQLALDTSKGLILNQSARNYIEFSRFKSHYEVCHEQIEWMRSIMIFRTVTLLDALDCDVEDLARFVGLKDNIQILLAQCQEEKLIDYYYFSLEEQLYTAIAVQDTRARAARFIERATGLFEILVIDKIMSYLSLKDLRFFALPMDPEI